MSQYQFSDADIADAPAMPSNVPAVAHIAPQNAVDALKNGPGVGVPPVAAMHDPAQVNGIAQSQRDTAILQNSPHVATWAAGDPVKVAATQDDFPALANIVHKIGQIPVLSDFLRPGYDAVHNALAGARELQDPNSTESQRLQATEKMSASDILFSPITGLTNIFSAPAAKGIVNIPGYIRPGENKQTVEDTLRSGFNFVGGFAVPLPFLKGKGEPVGRPTAAEHAPDFVPQPPAPSGPDGRFATDEHGFMTAADGTPASFNSPKEAAVWRLRNASEGTQIFEHDLHPETKTYGLKQVAESEPFSTAPPPGVDPQSDALYITHAEQGQTALKAAEEAVAESQTHQRMPELVEEFINQVAPEQTVKIDAQALTQHVDLSDENLDKLGVSWADVYDAYGAGTSIEIPLSKYLAAAAGAPWADALRPHVAIGDGVSKEEAKELNVKPFEIKNTDDLQKVYDSSQAAADSYHDWSQAVHQILPTATHEDQILFSKDVATGKINSPEEQAVKDTWLAFNKHAGIDEPEGEPTEHPVLAGKEFLEPSDLPSGDFDEVEQGQWAKASAAVKAAVPRVVKENFLGKLFKDNKAMGISQPLYNAYSSRIEKAFDDLVKKLWKQTHDKVKKQYSQQYATVYNNIFPTVMNEVMARPVIMAEHALRFSKAIEDDIIKDNALVTNGVPNVYYHGSTHHNVGTEENPWQKVGYQVISFSTSPQFSNDWIGGNDFDPYDNWNTPDRETGKAKTIYVVNLKAKNAADFRKPEDVEKAARWLARHEIESYDRMSDEDKKYALQQTGLQPILGDKGRELYVDRLASQFRKPLSDGSYTYWERSQMWADLGWDAAHMKESPSSRAVNIAVADGSQVYFRYRLQFEKPGMKLSLDNKTAYPKHLTEALPNNMFSREHGRSADEVASELGFPSGEDMLRQLAEFEQAKGKGNFRQFIKKYIEAEARQRTMDQVGDILSPDRILEDARALFTSPEVIDLLSTELKALADQVGTPITAEQVQDYANTSFDQRPIKQAMRIKDYERAIKKWGDQAELAMAKGKPDYPRAFDAKQKQLINVVQLKRAHELMKSYAKATARFSVLAKHRQLPSLEQSTLDAIHGELEKVGYSVPKANLNYLYSKWAAEQNALGNSVPPERPIPSVTKVDDLNSEQFEDLVDRIENMEHVGKENQKLLVNGKKVDHEAAVQEAIDRSKDVRKKPRTNVVSQPKEKFSLEQWDAASGKVESMLDKLDDGDPNGIWNRLLMWGGRDAHASEIAIKKQFLDKINSLRLKQTKAQKKAWTQAIPSGHGLLDPVTGKELDLTHYDLLGVVLNMGSEINRWHLEEGGWNWDRDAYEGLVHRHVTTEDMKFVQGMLDHLEELWPQIADNERAMSGLVPERVKAQVIRHQTQEYRGGYWPLARDYRRSLDPGHKDLDSMFESFLHDATTPKGFTKKRTYSEYVTNLDWQMVMFDHMSKVSKRLAFGQYVLSANKFLKDKRIANLVQDVHGQYGMREVKNWLHRQVGFRMVDPNALIAASDFLRMVRENMYMTQAGFNLAILAEHATAISQSVAVIGGKATKEGYVRWGMNPLGTAQFAHDSSPFMANRMTEVNRELTDIGEDLKQDVKLLRIKVNGKVRNIDTPLDAPIKLVRQAAALSLAAVNHYTIAVPTWTGAYNAALKGTKGLEPMTHEQAVRYADKAVSKSHSTGAAIDLSTFQTGNEFSKLINAYYSYHGNQMNLYREAAEKTFHGRSAKERAEGIRQGFWLMIAAALVGKVMTDQLPDMHKAKTGEQKAETLAGWTVDTILGGISQGVPLLREGFQAVDNRVRGRPWDFELSPVEHELVNLGKASENTFLTGAHALGLDKSKKVSHNAIQVNIEALGFVLGLPGAQPGRTAQVAIDMQKHPLPPGRVVPSLLYGPSHEKKK